MSKRSKRNRHTGKINAYKQRILDIEQRLTDDTSTKFYGSDGHTVVRDFGAEKVITSQQKVN